MSQKIAGNYLRTHRRRRLLTQRELGQLVGYQNSWQVGRHEKSKNVPPLMVALAYEVVLEVPVSELFTGIHAVVVGTVTRNCEELKSDLESRAKERRLPEATIQKLEWLRARSIR